MQFTPSFFQTRLEHLLKVASKRPAGPSRRRIVMRAGRQASTPPPSLAARTDALSRQVRKLALQFGKANSSPPRVAIATVGGRALWAPAENWKRVCHFMLSAAPDPGVLAYLARNLSAGADFVDLGAGLGAYALAAAEIHGDGVIHACESDPEAFGWLSKNVRAAGRVRAYPAVFPEALETAGREVGLVRVGGSAPVGHVLTAMAEILRLNPQCRVVVEYCQTLHGGAAVLDGLIAQGRALGRRPLRVGGDGNAGELRPHEIAGAFSLNIVWERSA